MTPVGVFPHCPAPTCISFPSFRLPWIKKNPQRNVQPNPAGWAAACTPFPFSSFHFDLAPLVSFFCAPFSPSQPAAFGVKKVRRVAFCHVISTRVNSHKVLKVTALYLRKKQQPGFPWKMPVYERWFLCSVKTLTKICLQPSQ